MAKQTLEMMVYPKSQKKIYSYQELSAFHEYLQKFKFDYTMITGEVIRPIDWQKLYLDQNVINENGAVFVNDVIYGKNKHGEIHMTHNDIPLLELNNKLEQWNEWKEKQNFGERAKLLQWDTKEVAEKFKNNI